jgi:hypothetical protein
MRFSRPFTDASAPRCRPSIVRLSDSGRVRAENASPRLVGTERGLGAFGDAAGFVFGDCREDLDGEPVREGVIAAYKIHVGLAQERSHSDGSCESIELRNDERGLRTPGVRESAAQLRPLSSESRLPVSISV